jgi:indole-3-glycerol phosphate synthase
MSAMLERIITSKRAEIDAMRDDSDIEDTWAPTGVPAIEAALRRVAAATGPRPALRLIAEHKRMSPSAGALSTALSPGERAVAYAGAGAAAVSVLCDGPFFGGAWEHVGEARAALDAARLAAPVLAKEFILDAIQLTRARREGASGVLLIARIVSPTELKALVAAARVADLEPLVEIVDEQELAAALDARARVIGVNARDLDTLAIDGARAARVLAAIPEDRVAVHLSGLRTPADVAAVAATRADAALVGEALMRVDDPRALMDEMVRAAGSSP